MKEKIYSSFEVGKRYTKAFIKEELEKIYEEIGYKATPKAIELEKYFKTKFILLTNKETGKRDAGFEILEKLDWILCYGIGEDYFPFHGLLVFPYFFCLQWLKLD